MCFDNLLSSRSWTKQTLNSTHNWSFKYHRQSTPKSQGSFSSFSNLKYVHMFSVSLSISPAFSPRNYNWFPLPVLGLCSWFLLMDSVIKLPDVQKFLWFSNLDLFSKTWQLVASEPNRTSWRIASNAHVADFFSFLLCCLKHTQRRAKTTRKDFFCYECFSPSLPPFPTSNSRK